MLHANARFTPAGRLLMVQRVEAGMPVVHVAAQMGVSRGTVAKWWRRYVADGEAGLVDRSPRRTSARVEERVCRLRRSTRRGPVYLSARTGVPAATVWRILERNGLNRLYWIYRPTGRVTRRYERSAPGELVHLDIKKVEKIPPGGGWRIHGRGSAQARRSKRRKPVGYTFLHVAIDDYSRVAYVEAHDNETAVTLVGFWRRAQGWFWSNDIAIDEVMTDNGPNFRSDAFAERCSPSGPSNTSAPACIGPKPTAKQSGSTAPSQTSSSTTSGSDPKTNDASASNAGYTTTTVTDTTPP